jgi:hypothetical protein
MNIELTDEQRSRYDALVADLHDDEVLDSYRLHLVSSSRPFPLGTVMFKDGTDRRWYIRPDGSFTWET